MNERKKSRRQKMADEGVLNSQYTQNGWFVKVKPAFGITKIVFSFVMKGKAGEGFDIYMDLDTFDNWADDIERRNIFEQILANEKNAGEQFPKTYKYITGDNGEKSVGIANAKKGSGYIINGVSCINNNKVFANVPVDMDWLRTTVKYYRRSVKESKVFEELARTTLEVASKYHKELSEDEPDYTPADNSSSTVTSLDEMRNSSVNTALQSSKDKKTDEGYKINKPIPIQGKINVMTKSELISTEGGQYYISATCEGKDCFVVFTSEFIRLLGERFLALEARAKETPVKLSFYGSVTYSSKGIKTYYPTKID